MLRSFGTATAFAVVLMSGLIAAPALAGPTPEKVLRRMDANGDGQVSRGEWLNPPPAFKRIDSNNDGVLTYEELRARFGGGSGFAQKRRAEPIKWIDVHVHPNGGRGPINDFPGAVQAAVDVMDANHISHMVLMPQPQVPAKYPPAPIERWIEEARKYPEHFVVMGGGGSLNPMMHVEGHGGHADEGLKRRFADRAEAIMELGAVGFGEVAILHLSLVPGHSLEEIPGDHPLLLMLADITAQHDVVIDVHYDPVLEDMERPAYLPANNPPVLKRNIDAFERFLAHNRRAKISWAHAGSDQLGFWTAAFTREMLAKHPNLYMSLRMSMGRSGKNHPLTPRGIDPDWMRTFKEYPDRFFLGGDQFFVPDGVGGAATTFARMSDTKRQRSVTFLSYLPPDIARKIAYENAVRVYKIKNTTRLRGN